MKNTIEINKFLNGEKFSNKGLAGHYLTPLSKWHLYCAAVKALCGVTDRRTKAFKSAFSSEQSFKPKNAHFCEQCLTTKGGGKTVTLHEIAKNGYVGLIEMPLPRY
jgi:hypothetical protein